MNDAITLDQFETYDGYAFKLVEKRHANILDARWYIKRNFMTLHICDTREIGMEKFYAIKSLFNADKQIMKGGEYHGRI